MNDQIKEYARTRGVTRICHFTPARNLHHVLKSGQILDRASLEKAEDKVVNPTDSQRFDGHPDKICCSVEYPNAYYLDVASRNDPLFKDWVILFLKPALLWTPGTVFCRQNAAKNRGGLVEAGFEGYTKLYAASIDGRRRQTNQLSECPTDIQAEVLVPGPVDFSEVLGIAMRTVEQAQTELVRWSVLGMERPAVPVFIAPTLFDKVDLRNHIWAGTRPEEVRYV